MRTAIRTAGAVALAAVCVPFAFTQTPPPAADQPLGPSGRIQARYAPSPRINKFAAEPSSI
jgi:hypothetical protein